MSLEVLSDGHPVHIGALEISLYRCATASLFWEKRVCHAVISDKNVGAIVTRSDGLLSEKLIPHSLSGIVNNICLFIGKNNPQVPPLDAVGTYENLLPLPQVKPNSLGIDMFYEVLCAIPEQMVNTLWWWLSAVTSEAWRFFMV